MDRRFGGREGAQIDFTSFSLRFHFVFTSTSLRFHYCRERPAYGGKMVFGNPYRTPCSGCFVSVGPATVFGLQKSNVFDGPYLYIIARRIQCKKQRLLNIVEFIIVKNVLRPKTLALDQEI